MGLFNTLINGRGKDRKDDRRYLDIHEMNRVFLNETSDLLYEVDDLTYKEIGVAISPVVDALRITYTGILTFHQSEKIYAVIGYGDNYKWEEVTTLELLKKENGVYEVLFHPQKLGNINIVFKDSAEHWDNNSGLNYTFLDQTYDILES